MNHLVKKYWFLIGILVAVALALILPSLGAVDGILLPDITAKYIAVWIVFLISGLSNTPENFINCIYQYKLNLFIQVISLFLMPLFVRICTALLTVVNIDSWLMKGLVVLSCMPPPITSSVVLTRTLGGNEAAAIFNSVVGSMLAIVVTPLMLVVFLGTTTLVPLFDTVWSLVCQVMAPVALGLLARKYTGFQADDYPLDTVCQGALLYIVYITFCQTFLTADLEMGPDVILATVALVVLIQICTMFIVFNVARRISAFSEADVIAALFCCTQKSLTIGFPMLRMMFSGYSHLSATALPLLMYYPTQIIIANLASTSLRKWAKNNQKPRNEGSRQLA